MRSENLANNANIQRHVSTVKNYRLRINTMQHSPQKRDNNDAHNKSGCVKDASVIKYIILF